MQKDELNTAKNHTNETDNLADPGAFGNRTFAVSLWLFAVVLCVTVILKSPYFALNRVDLIGQVRITEEDILRTTGFQPGESLFSLDLTGGENRIARLPLVKEVRLRRQLPGVLQAVVVERQPMGWLASPDGFWAVDPEGIPLFLSHQLNLTLPLITMEPFTQPEPGVAIESTGLLGALEFAAALSISGLAVISEIHVGENELFAYTHDGTSIMLGRSHEMAEKARILEGLLRDIERGGFSVIQIDMRHPQSPAITRR